MIGSSSTQSNGTTIVLERSRPSVVGPSSVYGTIASSTLTFAIVRSSRCGFRTTMRISPGENSTRRMSNSSAGGGFVPTRSTSDEPAVTTTPTTSASSRTGTTAQRRQLTRPRSGVAECGLHQSTTSKKPIQPSSANSDWCAWNMKAARVANSISSTPRWPWHCITVSVYSQWSPVPVGW